MYRKDPKFFHTDILANFVDPHQTKGSTLFAILSASFGHIRVWYSHTVQISFNFSNFWGWPNVLDIYCITYFPVLLSVLLTTFAYAVKVSSFAHMSHLMTKPTKGHVRPGKIQISLDQPGHPSSLIRAGLQKFWNPNRSAQQMTSSTSYKQAFDNPK